MKEIIKIIENKRTTSDMKIRPTIATHKDGEEWREVNSRLGRKKTVGQINTKEMEINRIPVIVNRFVLPSKYMQDIDVNESETSVPVKKLPKQALGKNKANRSTVGQRKLLILGDSHARSYADKLKTNLKNFSVCGIVKPNARSKEVLEANIQGFTKKDSVVICAGTNDIGKNCTKEGLANIVKFVAQNNQTNIIILEAPHRYDLAQWSCVNKEIIRFNKRLAKMLKIYDYAKIQKVSLDRNNFTRHGLHMNNSGKLKIHNQTNRRRH